VVFLEHDSLGEHFGPRCIEVVDDQPLTASFIPTNGPSVVRVLPPSTRTVVAFSGSPMGTPGVTPGT